MKADTHVYIDESGELGRKSKYIVFASISCNSPRPLEKAIKKIWKAKPQLHVHGELHANMVDDATRTRVNKTIDELGVRIEFMVVAKAVEIRPLAEVYYLALAEFIQAHNQAQIIVIDKKDTNKKRNVLIGKLGLSEIFAAVKFEESHRVRQLQAVDFVAWSIGRYYEHGDDTFIKMFTLKERKFRK